jgi:hypothetical protein
MRDSTVHDPAVRDPPGRRPHESAVRQIQTLEGAFKMHLTSRRRAAGPFRLGAAALALATAAAATPAAAQTTEDGADALRLDIKRLLATQLMALPEVGTRIDLDGDIAVTPAGAVYEITIPAAMVLVQPKGDDVVGAQMAAITGTAAPRDNGWLDISLDLPGEIVLEQMGPDLDAVGAMTGEDQLIVTIAERRADMTVAPDYGGLVAADIVLGGMLLVPTEEEGRIEVGEAALIQTADQRDDGALDMVYDVGVSDVVFVDGEREVFRLGRIGFDGFADGVRLDALMAFSEEMNALSSELAAREPQPADFEAMAMTLDNLPLLFETVTGAYALEDLTFETDDMVVDLGEARFGVGIDGLGGAASTMSLELGVRDLAVDPTPPMAQGFMPQTVAIAVRLADLPNEALMQAMNQVLTMAAQSGPEMAMMMGMGAIQGALMSGEAAIVIDELIVDTESAGVTGDARVEPSADSIFGVVAQASLAVAGLDAIIQGVQGLPDGQSIASVLTLVQAMGRDDTGAEGQPVKVFDIDFTPEGQVLLNGNDMGPLMQGLQ